LHSAIKLHGGGETKSGRGEHCFVLRAKHRGRCSDIRVPGRRRAGGKPAHHFFERLDWNPTPVERHDEGIKNTRAEWSKRLVAAGARFDDWSKLPHSSSSLEVAIKLRVFQKRTVWVTTHGKKVFAPRKEAAVAKSNAKKVDANIAQRIAKKINPTARDNPQPKTTTGHHAIAQRIDDRAQGVWRDTRIGVHNLNDFASGDFCSGIHLFCASRWGGDEVIRNVLTQLCRPIMASTVDDNDFGLWRDAAQMPKKADNNRRFI